MSSHPAHPLDHAKPPKKPCHGPGDCYGMPEKKFWRIIWIVTFVTMTIVISLVILVNKLSVL